MADKHDRPIKVRPGQASPVHTWLPQYRRLVRDEYYTIDLRLLGEVGVETLSLQDVYTPLYSSKLTIGGITSDARRLLDEAILESRAMVIVGHSGSGKSTFFRQVAQEELEKGSAVPFLVELADLNYSDSARLAPGARLSWKSLIGCLIDRLGDDGVEVSHEAIDALAAASETLWLLDGLNEVVDSRSRRALAATVRSLQRRWPLARFVISTTDSTIRDGTAPAVGASGFDRIYIGDFDRDDVEQFLDTFARSLSPADSDETLRSKWEPLAVEIFRDHAMTAFLRSPLYLTAAAVLYLTDHASPMVRERSLESRASLLASLVRWWLRKRSDLFATIIGRDVSIETLVGEIALAMMQLDQRPQKRLGRRAAVELIAPLEGLDGDKEKAERFLEAALAAGSLLARSGAGDVMMHETVRDYLAARQLADLAARESFDNLWSIVQPHLDDTAWRSCLQMTPVCLAGDGTSLVTEFFSRLSRDAMETDLTVRIRRVALCWRAVRESAALFTSPVCTAAWRDLANECYELFTRPLTQISLQERHEAALAIGLIGDERFDHRSDGWAHVDRTTVLSGAQRMDVGSPGYDPDAAPWEAPVLERRLGPFDVRCYLVTVREYGRFVEAGGYSTLRRLDWPASLEETLPDVTAPLDWTDQALFPNTPVTGVSWYEATAYCNWITANEGGGAWEFRLPSEWEWELVARTDLKGSQFPWGRGIRLGDAAEANWAGALIRRKTPPGMFPQSTTKQGVADLYGNVEEWCRDSWLDTPTGWQTGELREKRMKVVRGGSCIRFSRLCRPTYRSRVLAEGRYHTVGFRIVRVETERAGSR